MATVCDIYHPFDAGAGADVLEDRWRQMARFWSVTGPINAYANSFQVIGDSTGMQVKVKTGAAFILGQYAENTAQKTLPVAAYSTNRIDRVILRNDFANNRIELDVLTGTASPPALTQNSSKWEIALAQILVTNGTTIASTDVYDTRQFAAGQGGLSACISGQRPSTTGLGAPYDGLPIYETDTNRVRVYDGVNWQPIGGVQVGGQFSRTSNVSCADSAWTLQSLTTVEDPDGIHASTNGYVTLAEGGVYIVSGRASFASNAVGGRGVAIHRAAGTPFSSGNPSDALALIANAGTNSTNVAGTLDVRCASGDVISLCAFQSSGGALNCTGAYLSVRKVGA